MSIEPTPPQAAINREAAEREFREPTPPQAAINREAAEREFREAHAAQVEAARAHSAAQDALFTAENKLQDANTRLGRAQRKFLEATTATPIHQE